MWLVAFPFPGLSPEIGKSRRPVRLQRIPERCNVVSRESLWDSLVSLSLRIQERCRINLRVVVVRASSSAKGSG